MGKMGKDRVLDSLADARRVAFSIWSEYHEKAIDSDIWSDVRDYYDMRVRALDYAMEVLKHDAI